MDKRIEAMNQVKKKLADALIRLLDKEPLSNITVTKLIAEAGVARVSFYRHYSSLEDILRLLIDELIGRFAAEAPTQNPNFSDLLYMEYSFEFYKKYKKTFLILKESGLSDMIHASIDHFTFLNTKEIPREERDDLSFASGAFYSYAMRWLEQDTPTTPEEEAEGFVKRIKNGCSYISSSRIDG
ncbi:MAG: TetR family transcriptional regulator [Lachnospiraceae bacterium]|nr:TetR family transcriptional regulator [Lachnospiraceae bacterium]MBR5733480.1 TetR family transcriptional regulator [Lachnospiraceae bacterium]